VRQILSQICRETSFGGVLCFCVIITPSKPTGEYLSRHLPAIFHIIQHQAFDAADFHKGKITPLRIFPTTLQRFLPFHLI